MPDPQILLTGLAFGESPRWHDGRLWFADWMAHEIVAVGLDGQREKICDIPWFAYSFDWLPDGTLLVTGAGERALSKLDGGTLVPHANATPISPLGWNEIVVDGRGNTYINNVGFDMMAGAPPQPGIIALMTPDGAVRQVGGGVMFPNGMAVTPDNAVLIVAESYGRKLTAFDIAPDGALSNQRTWADLGDGAPDGICVDADGAVWYADVPNKRCVRIREGGVVLQTVQLDRGAFACMLGGGDGRKLFIVAREWHGPQALAEEPRTGQVLTVEAPAPHAGWP
jgi:sugar lactone lactonase YvrE